MMRIFRRSLRFGIADQFKEFLEQIIGIVRARRRLRLVLDTECGYRPMLEPFDGVVVKIDVCNFDVAEIQALRIDRESVILRCDFHLPAFQIQHRMIAAVMSELELVCLPTESQTQNLVSETNPEDGFSPEKTPHILDRIFERLRISGPVRQKNSVGLQIQNAFGGGRRRNYSYFRAAAREIAQDMRLDSEIVRHHVEGTRTGVGERRKLNE